MMFVGIMLAVPDVGEPVATSFTKVTLVVVDPTIPATATPPTIFPKHGAAMVVPQLNVLGDRPLMMRDCPGLLLVGAWNVAPSATCVDGFR